MGGHSAAVVSTNYANSVSDMEFIDKDRFHRYECGVKRGWHLLLHPELRPADMTTEQDICSALDPTSSRSSQARSSHKPTDDAASSDAALEPDWSPDGVEDDDYLEEILETEGKGMDTDPGEEISMICFDA